DGLERRRRERDERRRLPAPGQGGLERAARRPLPRHAAPRRRHLAVPPPPRRVRAVAPSYACRLPAWRRRYRRHVSSAAPPASWARARRAASSVIRILTTWLRLSYPSPSIP